MSKQKERPGWGAAGANSSDAEAMGLSNTHNSTTSPAVLQGNGNGNGAQPGAASTLQFALKDDEEMLLGALLGRPEEVLEKVGDRLDAALFQLERHVWIFEAIQSVRRAGQQIDYVTAFEAYQAANHPPVTDDMEYLASLPDFVTSGHYNHLIEIVDRLEAARLKQDTTGILSQHLKRLMTTGDVSISGLQSQIETLSQREGRRTGPAESPYDRFVCPLPKNIAGLDHLGDIGKIARLISTLADAPESYGLLTALTVTATAINRRAVLRLAHGDIYPNLYAGMVGPSSVTHKSTTMGLGRRLLKLANLDRFAIPANPTAEGLLNRLANTSTGLLFRDEMGSLLSSHRTKYLRQLKEDLMALYGCEPHGRQLASGEVTVNEPYLSIIGTTTPERFFSSLGDTDWTDGFLVRWLIALPSRSPDFDTSARLVSDDEEEELHGFANTLRELAQREAKSWSIETDALGQWNNWRNYRRQSAYEAGDGLALALIERYAIAALKLAMILAAPEKWGHIDFDCISRSIELAEYFEASLLRLKDMKEQLGISGGKLQKVLRLLNDRGPLKAGEVQRNANMDKHEAGEVLAKLLDIGAIVTENTASGRTLAYKAVTESLPIRSWS